MYAASMLGEANYHVSSVRHLRMNRRTGLKGSEPGLIICDAGDSRPLCRAIGVRGEPVMARFGLPPRIWLSGMFCGTSRGDKFWAIGM
jgi:hypothetical protein